MSPSNSTVPTVKAALVSLLSDALTVDVFYSWQPDVTSDCCFLGRALLDPADRDEIEIEYEYPTAETNRPCWETYTVPISAWSFRGDLSPEDAATADQEFDVMVADLLGVLADVDLGLGTTVNSRPSGATTRRVPFQSGWAVFAVVELVIVANLN